MKQPTSLKRLNELITLYKDHEGDQDAFEIENWLVWAHDMLVTRKVYHKKRALRMKRSIELLKEHLSADELHAIDQQAAEEAMEVDSVDATEAGEDGGADN